MASGHLNYDQGAEESQSHILEPLTADDEEFQKIIERLKSDPDYKALVVSVGSRTHFPYVGGLYEEFVEQFPEHKVDLPAKRFQELHKEYYQNHLAYSLAFDQTAAERGLSEKDKEQLTQVVDAVYKASVYELDKDVGRLLTAIDDAGLKDDSLIAFTVDHGEVMTTETAPHRWTHGYMVTPEMMNVPLLIRGPAVKAKVVESVSRAVDVFPTLMALSGRALSAEHKIDGQDFSAAAAGTGEAPKVKAPFHTSLMLTSYYDTHHKMLALSDYLKAHFSSEGPETIWTGSRDMDTLYVYRPDGKEWGLQVFDLATDPIMKKNLYDESNPEHKTALEELAARKQNIVKTFEEKQDIIKEMRIPEEVEKEKLKSLNYI